MFDSVLDSFVFVRSLRTHRCAGKLRDVQDAGSLYTYVLDDGTGCTEVKTRHHCFHSF